MECKFSERQTRFTSEDMQTELCPCIYLSAAGASLPCETAFSEISGKGRCERDQLSARSRQNVVHKPGKSTTSGLRSREARERVTSSDEIQSITREIERVRKSGSGGGEAVALPPHPPKAHERVREEEEEEVARPAEAAASGSRSGILQTSVSGGGGGAGEEIFRMSGRPRTTSFAEGNKLPANPPMGGMKISKDTSISTPRILLVRLIKVVPPLNPLTKSSTNVSNGSDSSRQAVTTAPLGLKRRFRHRTRPAGKFKSSILPPMEQFAIAVGIRLADRSMGWDSNAQILKDDEWE
ncbi:hypothetical protein WN55_05118 [Dufourea novaeangliae]|uniref:Uncharacterized protein n=1 Tax=Dufourea novaeangliae TaxID=178035 RepID=A0A154PNV7_DUFNO|nr:hypothetical protein WN55_05118 [Dufourea novaeangliae]